MSGPYWTKAWNITTGCTPVSPGCEHCWARAMHGRFSDRPFEAVMTHPERLSAPLHWRKPQTVFVANMGDLFHPALPFAFIAQVFGVMAGNQQHTFLLCTKRPSRMREWFRWAEPRIGEHIPRFNVPWPLPNMWLGVTAEDQQRADERIPILLDTPAAHRWVSVEPMLGPMDLHSLNGIDQVIVGGEGGGAARDCDADWIRSIIGQCKFSRTPCFVKQLGTNAIEDMQIAVDHWEKLHYVVKGSGADPSEWPDDLRVRQLAWGMA